MTGAAAGGQAALPGPAVLALLGVALALLGVALAPAGLRAQSVGARAVVPARPTELPPGYLATTRCVGGEPVTYLYPYLDPLTRRETEAHEAVHRRQLAGACEERLRALERDATLRLAHEAEAYCAGLAALGLDSTRYPVAVERLREGLHELFEEQIPHAEVDAALERYCSAPGR